MTDLGDLLEGLGHTNEERAQCERCRRYYDPGELNRVRYERKNRMLCPACIEKLFPWAQLRERGVA